MGWGRESSCRVDGAGWSLHPDSRDQTLFDMVMWFPITCFVPELSCISPGMHHCRDPPPPAFSAWRSAHLDSVPACPHMQVGRGHCGRATNTGAHIKGSWSYVPGDGKGHTCSHEGHPFVFGVVWPFLSLVGLNGNREGALSIHHMLGGWHKQRHWDSL